MISRKIIKITIKRKHKLIYSFFDDTTVKTMPQKWQSNLYMEEN